MEIIKAEFNYQALDAESRIVVRQRTGEIHSLVRRSAQDIFDIGQKLIEVKEKLQHGQFGDWLDIEFGWSAMTANRFMSVAEQFKSNNLLDLNIAPSALYLLAAPSTEPETRQQFIEQAQAGQPVTHKQVKAATSSPANYGYSKAQQTKLPPKIKTKSAFTASPPALDDFNQASYSELYQYNDTAGFDVGPGNGHPGFAGLITTLEAAGYFVVSPDLNGGLPRLLTVLEASGYFVISPAQVDDPLCPYCGHSF